MHKSLGATLTSLRRMAGYTQVQVTRLLAERGYEIQSAGISKWEKDLTMPNAAQFLALCQIYGVTDVLGTFTDSGASSNLNEEGRRLVANYVRVLEASGCTPRPSPARRARSRSTTWPSARAPGSSWTARATSLSTPTTRPGARTLPCELPATAWSPDIPDGSIVWVHSCDTLESGHVGIFVYGGQAYCKRLRINSVGVMLISANRQYAPIIIRPENELHVCGEVVGLALLNNY